MAEERGMVATVIEMLKREPFVPFHIMMSSGDRISIETPELAAVASGCLTCCMPRSNAMLYLRLNQIAMLQIDDLWAVAKDAGMALPALDALLCLRRTTAPDAERRGFEVKRITGPLPVSDKKETRNNG